MASILYCIGDIHGCLTQLKTLMEMIEDDAGHRDAKIVFVGDYIDRGPDSKGVVDFLINLKNSKNREYIFLKGNHEDMMMDPYGQRDWWYNGGKQTMDSYRCESFRLFPEDHQEWFKNLRTYYQYGRFVFVHAGLDPSLKLEDQSEHSMLWNRKYVGYNGEYEGGYFVTYGHTPLSDIIRCNNGAGIDTGCVFDDADLLTGEKAEGKLSAIRIEPDIERITFMAVRGEKKIFDPHVRDRRDM